MDVQTLVEHFDLHPHPEGGFYKETYRSKGMIEKKCLLPEFIGNRNYSTAIYFLLQQGDFSAFHRIKSDECWHFYEGDTLLIYVIHTDGVYQCTKLGKRVDEGEVYQAVVPAGAWFASEPAEHSSFSFVGCTVSPGFDFADFEMASAETLAKEFPQQKSVIHRLCR